MGTSAAWNLTHTSPPQVHLRKAVKAALRPGTLGTPTNAAITKSLHDAFAATETELLRMARIRKKRDGTCALVALVVGDRLFTAHVGDSRGTCPGHTP